MIDVVVPAGALLGECPLWSRTDQLLYWIDIDGRLIHRFDPSTGNDTAVRLNGRPGSVALTPEPGRLLAAVEQEVGFVDVETGEFEPWIRTEESDSRNRLNDGRVDPIGRFWVGSMFERPAERRMTGALHRIDLDGAVTVHRRDVGVSNSLAFAPDGRTMYWSDTHTGLVWSHPYDPDTGEPGTPRVFVDFAELPGGPDGACVDDTGAIWIACVGGASLVRISPTGAIDRLVELPVESPTMPAFGGPDLRSMFITSIGAATSASSPVVGAHDGAVLAWDPGVQGIPEPSFEGGKK